MHTIKEHLCILDCSADSFTPAIFVRSTKKWVVTLGMWQDIRPLTDCYNWPCTGRVVLSSLQVPLPPSPPFPSPLLPSPPFSSGQGRRNIFPGGGGGGEGMIIYLGYCCFLNFQVSFCGQGRTFGIHIDTWPVPHHSSDMCVMIAFQARINIPLHFEVANIHMDVLVFIHIHVPVHVHVHMYTMSCLHAPWTGHILTIHMTSSSSHLSDVRHGCQGLPHLLPCIPPCTLLDSVL